jgi:STE24 endopeptidase
MGLLSIPLVIPPEAMAVPLDVAAATRAYLSSVPSAARAASDAYYEGGYWLQLWDLLVGSAIAVLLLQTGASAKMRVVATRAATPA